MVADLVEEAFTEASPTLPSLPARRGVPTPEYRLQCTHLRRSPHPRCHGGGHAVGSEQRNEAVRCPVARYGHSLTEIRQDMLLLFGGVSNDREYLNDAWILRLSDAEIESVSLEVVGDAPSGRAGHSAYCTLNGKYAIIFGGANSTDWFRDLYIAPLAELTSSLRAVFQRVEAVTLAPSPVLRSFVSSSLPVAAAPASSLTRESASLAWPSARRSHTLVPMEEGKAILFGGHSVVSVNDVWILDEKSFAWRQVETRGLDSQFPLMGIPASRYCHSSVVYPNPTSSAHATSDAVDSSDTAASSSYAEVGRSLYVFGGVLFSPFGDNALWELSLSTFIWRRVKVRGGVLPPPRFGHIACVLSHCMIVFGGADKFPSGRSLDDCFMYNFRSREWSPLNSVASRSLTADPAFPTHCSADAALTTEAGSHLNPSAFSHLSAALSRGHRALEEAQEEASSRMPPGRRSHAAARSARGKIIIFGGWDGCRVDGECFQLRLAPSTLRERCYAFLMGTRRPGS
ncbi:kelch repeat protein [Trypanosoma conorhini]|uniref:Kelch repeat protein n=1 Tax=Trypanosoma conorhini TaxID=83891 RepID=A0A3R7LKJ4_9TRYP|nr:kelch repeat protein [Trypanosoma conorhini]RNF16210.1 kelch repeat protein [Trypanosoma conorhini]